MKSRLFWKILLGFWITIVFMLQGVWMAYAVLWQDRSSYEREVAQTLAPYQLSAATMAIETGGVAKFETLTKVWRDQSPERGPRHEEWVRLAVAPASTAPIAQNDRDAMHVRAVDPQAKAWDITYTLPLESRDDSWGFQDFLRFYVTLEWAIPGVLCGLLFSAVLAWYLTRPIQGLRAGFRKLADGVLETRLQPRMGRRRDEIADLAEDFDRMAERLQQLVLARDHLLHDVSHELRSPLARLNLAAALAIQEAGTPRESLQRIQTEVGRLDVLVGELLSLSRRESGASELDAYFDMRSLVDAVVEDAAFEAQAKRVTITRQADAGEKALIQGSAELIRRAIENVIRNAVQFSGRGDVVRVSLTVKKDSRRAVLRIADQGPGVPEADLKRMLEPFVRLGNGREQQGYGLGLAIASRAVHSHKGTLDIANQPEGGLVITLALPLADMAPQLVEGIFENDA